MINNILTNPAIYHITQSNGSQVSIETGLKAIARPGFIIADQNIDKQTKKYSATKELLFQPTCFVSLILVVIPVFKKGSFKVARKLFKDEPIFRIFKNSSEFNKYHKLSPEEKILKLAEINKEKNTNYQIDERDKTLQKG